MDYSAIKRCRCGAEINEGLFISYVPGDAGIECFLCGERVHAHGRDAVKKVIEKWNNQMHYVYTDFERHIMFRFKKVY